MNRTGIWWADLNYGSQFEWETFLKEMFAAQCLPSHVCIHADGMQILYVSDAPCCQSRGCLAQSPITLRSHKTKSWLSAFTSAFPWQLHSLFFVTVVEHFPGCCLCPAHGSTDWFCAPQTRASSSMQAIFCSCWHTACVGQWHACRSRHLQPWTSLQTHLPLRIIYLQPFCATCFSISMGDFSNLLPPFSSHLSGMGWRNWQCQVRHGRARAYLPVQQSDARQEQCCCTVKGNVKMLPLCPSATPRPILLLGAWNKVGDANKSFILASDSPSEYICDWQALGSAKTLRIFN